MSPKLTSRIPIKLLRACHTIILIYFYFASTLKFIRYYKRQIIWFIIDELSFILFDNLLNIYYIIYLKMYKYSINYDFCISWTFASLFTHNG